MTKTYGAKSVILIITLLVIFYSTSDASLSSTKSQYQSSFLRVEDYDGIIKNLISHDPINIDSDLDFAAYGFLGNGSENDPYVIENYSIVTTNSYGIRISGTSKHFVVKNCYIDSDGWGLTVNSVADYTATIIDNYVYYNLYDGITLDNVKGAVIANNTCFYNNWGIFLARCEETSITNNTCNSNYGNGIEIEYCSNLVVNENIVNHNRELAGIDITHSDSILVANNTCNSNRYRGIHLWESTNITVEDNLLSYNDWCGIGTYGCNRLKIINNTANYNEVGIFHENSDNSEINDNKIIYNYFRSIFLASTDNNPKFSSDNNFIHHNTLMHYTETRAQDDGNKNTWYDEVNFEGNTWNDYKGWGFYEILDEYERIRSIDRYPMLLNIAIDEDNDTMPDVWENLLGLDTEIDDSDLDPDLDTITNVQEYFNRTHPFDEDTENDGLSDGEEINIYLTCPLLPDTDSDKLDDYDEIFIYFTNPLDEDTDSDLMDDYWEVINSLDPLNNDSLEDLDEDGLTNYAEYLLDTNPNNNDTDNDGLLDNEEVSIYLTDPRFEDSDSDGMIDGWEVHYNLNPRFNDAEDDADEDGVTNLREFQHGTNPRNNDTDSDGYDDCLELEYGTDPTDPEDFPVIPDEEDTGTISLNFLYFLGAILIISIVRLSFRKYKNKFQS
jgi:parallel beta-helix repeat protein